MRKHKRIAEEQASCNKLDHRRPSGMICERRASPPTTTGFFLNRRSHATFFSDDADAVLCNARSRRGPLTFKLSLDRTLFHLSSYL